MRPTGVTIRTLLAALALACSLALTSCSSAPAPTPASAPTPADTPTAAEVIRHGALTGLAADDAGDVMSVWQWCRHGSSHCWHTWRIARTAGGAVTGAVDHGLAPTAYAAADGFVLRRWDRPGEVVAPDGSSTPLSDAPPGNPVAGDIVVRTRTDLAVVDAARAAEWPIPHPRGVDGWAEGTISSTGTLWLLAHGAGPGPVDLYRTVDGRHWTRTAVSDDRAGGDVPGRVVTSGDRVAVLATYDGATVAPVGTLAVSTDGGAHWRRLHRRDLPFETVDELAATRDGTLFVSSAEGEHLYRSADDTWTRFVPVRDGDRVADLTPLPHGLLAVQGTYRHWRTVTFDDRGQRSSAPASVVPSPGRTTPVS